MATILVIDDEPDIRTLVRLMLTRHGHSVVEAGTGEEGLEILQDSAVDIVLLDIRLPGTDGWAVLEEMKRRKLLNGTRVVMISAHTSPSTLAYARELGSSGYVVKPFKEDELLAVLEESASD